MNLRDLLVDLNKEFQWVSHGGHTPGTSDFANAFLSRV